VVVGASVVVVGGSVVVGASVVVVVATVVVVVEVEVPVVDVLVDEVGLLVLGDPGRVVLVDDPGIEVVLEDEPGPGRVVVVVVVEVVAPGLGALRRGGRPAGGLGAVVVVVSPAVPRVDTGLLDVDRTSFARLVTVSAAAIAAESRGSQGRVSSWVTSPSASICRASA
jgi:hypothetical protein